MTPTREVRLFVHGVPNAGKTSWFTGLYGLRDHIGSELLITVDDGATTHYLAQRWRNLKAGIPLRATAMGVPERLRWRCRLAEFTWDLTAIDYAGALVEVGRDLNTVALAAPVREHLVNSDAILVLLDTSDPDVQQLDALAIMLEELRKSDRPGLRPRPFAILLTKSDRLGDCTTDAAEMTRRGLNHFRAHPAFKQIDQLLKANCPDQPFPLEVFPVSLCGKSGPDGRLPPVTDWQPCNLYEPITWVLKQAEPLMDQWQADELEVARTKARACVGDAGWAFWPEFPRALRAYQEAERTARISTGPHADSAATEVNELRMSWRTWRRRAAALVVGILFLLLVGSWKVGCELAGWAFTEVEQFCETHGEDHHAADRLERQRRLLQTSWAQSDSWWGTTDRRHHLEARLADDQEALDRHTYAELVRERQALLGDENAAARLQLVASSPLRYHLRYHDTLLTFTKEDTQIDSRYREKKTHEAIVADVPAMRTKHQHRELHARCSDFLEQFPDSMHVGAIRSIQEIARLAWDEQAWEAAQAEEIRNPKDYRQQRDRYRSSQQVPGTSHVREAADAIQRLEKVWDREQYDEVRRKALQATTWEELREAADLAFGYLREDREFKAGREAIQVYSAWRDRLRGWGGICTVHIESLLVPEKASHRSDERSDKPLTFQVEVIIHKLSQKTEWFSLDQPTSHGSLSNYPLGWADELKAEVVLRDSRTEIQTRWKGQFTSGPPGAASLKPEAHFDLELTQQRGDKEHQSDWHWKENGIRMRVRVSCSGAVAPPLPPYPG